MSTSFIWFLQVNFVFVFVIIFFFHSYSPSPCKVFKEVFFIPLPKNVKKKNLEYEVMNKTIFVRFMNLRICFPSLTLVYKLINIKKKNYFFLPALTFNLVTEIYIITDKINSAKLKRIHKNLRGLVSVTYIYKQRETLYDFWQSVKKKYTW